MWRINLGGLKFYQFFAYSICRCPQCEVMEHNITAINDHLETYHQAQVTGCHVPKGKRRYKSVKNEEISQSIIYFWYFSAWLWFWLRKISKNCFLLTFCKVTSCFCRMLHCSSFEFHTVHCSEYDDESCTKKSYFLPNFSVH